MGSICHLVAKCAEQFKTRMRCSAVDDCPHRMQANVVKRGQNVLIWSGYAKFI